MYLVIDIGATKTLLALFSKQGRVVRRVKFPTAQGMATFFRTLAANLSAFSKYAIRGLVVAVPGTVQKNYTVRFGNRNWGDVDIIGWLKKLFSCPIYLENDANLAAIYEAYGLPGRTVYLTFSTGIGGGVVEDGKLVVENFEPGHRTYQYMGQTAEWEDLAAASAIERIYHVDLATELRGRKVMRDVAARIYLGLPDIAAEQRPDTIVIGGPIGKIFRLFSRYLPKIAGVTYARPKRPQESVIYGGYLYALEHDAYVSEYPEKLLRGMPATQIMMERAQSFGRKAIATGRETQRKIRRKTYVMGCSAEQKTRSLGRKARRDGHILERKAKQKVRKKLNSLSSKAKK